MRQGEEDETGSLGLFSLETRPRVSPISGRQPTGVFIMEDNLNLMEEDLQFFVNERQPSNLKIKQTNN